MIVGPWQVAHPVVMLTWFIAEFLKVAPFGTGVAAMLDPGPTWQVSHDGVEPVGTWFDGRPTIEKLADGIAKLGADGPWQVSQPPLVVGA